MKHVIRPAMMQRLSRQWRAERRSIGLVPTMGCLHAGHLSLVERARKAAGPRGRVVVSLYVNPTQFAPTEDLDAYPRDLKRDLALCRGAGVDVVFQPADEAMYPGIERGRYSTHVEEERLSRVLEGTSRPTHFRGVTTVVAKLLNLVGPDYAVFGAKDWQQTVVVRRMVADLNFPVKILLAPTVREPDGLAMSSRNQYLSPAQREQATILRRAILHARQRVRKVNAMPAAKLQTELKRLIESAPEARVDYIAFFESETLEPVTEVGRGTHLALAVFIGTTRLIDNDQL
jgi:pantoate--beta-alanine ligase